jgi:ubiquinone/menaquinone biosynthesis C-methylase UbiE
MLNRARKRIPRHAQVDFLQADVLTLAAAPGTFDVVVANFFFDCFTETQLSYLAHMIAETLRVGGKILIADFRIPPSGIAYFVGRALIGSLYRFFSLTCGLTNKCLVPPDEFLESAGLKKAHRKTSCGGLLHSEVWISEKAPWSSC